MFPQGGPGVALVLLRLSVAAFLVGNAASRSVLSMPIFFGGSVLLAGLLAIGLLTPFLSVVACAAMIGNLIIASHSANFMQFVPVLDAAALSLLGPGAYSLDARLFGRRVVTVPPRQGPNQI